MDKMGTLLKKGTLSNSIVLTMEEVMIISKLAVI